MKDGCDAMATVFLFDEDRFYPYDAAVYTADHIACVFVVNKCGIYWKLSGNVFVHFLAPGFDVWL